MRILGQVVTSRAAAWLLAAAVNSSAEGRAINSRETGSHTGRPHGVEGDVAIPSNIKSKTRKRTHRKHVHSRQKKKDT